MYKKKRKEITKDTSYLQAFGLLGQKKYIKIEPFKQ